MQKNNTINQKYLRNGVILSILLHLLILLSMTKVIFFPLLEKPKEQPQQHFYVPSYTVPSASAPMPQPSQPVQTSMATPQQNQTKGNTPHAKNIEKNFTTSPHGLYQKSVLDMSRDVLQQNQFTAAMNRSRDVEPMLLIGDTSQTADPIVRLIGRSLSAHFRYPKMEGSFGVKGRVLVEMVLHPEGYYSDVQIVKSSNNPDFDSAALYAVNTAPRVVGVDKLLTKPLDFIVGFIFD